MGGLIFVNMDGKAPALRDWIGLPPGYIENYEIEKMRNGAACAQRMARKWKTGITTPSTKAGACPLHPSADSGVMEDFNQYDLYPNGFSHMIRAHQRQISSRRRSSERRSMRTNGT